MRKEVETDPYATPTVRKSKAAGLIRGAIVVALVAVGGAVAYSVSQAPSQENAALEQQQSSNQQLADGSYAVTPQAAQPTAPEVAPVPAPEPAARTPAPRRAARESAPVEDPAPVPEATPLPATPAAPLPPTDVAPSASGQ